MINNAYSVNMHTPFWFSTFAFQFENQFFAYQFSCVFYRFWFSFGFFFFGISITFIKNINYIKNYFRKSISIAHLDIFLTCADSLNLNLNFNQHQTKPFIYFTCTHTHTLVYMDIVVWMCACITRLGLLKLR